MPQVNSSAITRIEYNEFADELLVTFTSGKTYAYYGVPEALYRQFLQSASRGQFFNTYIKDRYSVT